MFDPHGQHWNPTERESPHSFDYKLNIVDPLRQEELLGMIEQERESPGSVAFDLNWFHENGEFRKFTNSQSKQGMFVQAGAIVTDGFETGKITKVLATYRSSEQFHNHGYRNKSGDSIVFGTVLASFDKQDPHGHVPTCLFNDIHQYCPWALFSRKLLVPDIYMDSRFLGVGYNFERPERRYVFLLWHVRSKETPESLIVEARQKKEHDVPYWCPVDEISDLKIDDKPIDLLSISHVLKRPSETPPTNEKGFLPVKKFEQVWRKDWIPQPVNRDEIILDILRMYQVSIHGRRRSLTFGRNGQARKREAAFQEDLCDFLSAALERFRIRHEVISEPRLGHQAHSGRGDVRVIIRDVDGHEKFRYLIECKVSDSPETHENYILQCQGYVAALTEPHREDQQDRGIDAIVLAHGIMGEQNPYALQGAITHPSPDIPIHVIRIALEPQLPSRLRDRAEVVHAIIPLQEKNGQVEHLLFTRRPVKDECARLPGGGVDGAETTQEALARELSEELCLEAKHFRELRPIIPGARGQQPGLSITGMSVGHGVLRDYRFHPYLVVCSADGESHIRDSIRKPTHFPHPVRIQDWLSGKVGHDGEYANALMPFLTPELLDEAAIELEAEKFDE